MNNQIKVIAVVGPTASGKSGLAVELAKIFSGEVISCDSMQIYKGMDIGTAKVTKEEMQNVKHHLLDFVEVGAEYSVSDFVNDADNSIKEIISEGNLPIIAGGTGLYLKSLLYGVNFTDNSRDENYRKFLENEITDGKIEEIYEKLVKTDPKAAANIHMNNHKRVIRALEYCEVTGELFSEQSIISNEKYSHILICLGFKDREKLYTNINKRVDIMMKNGLLEEALIYKNKNLSTARQAIGYKELNPYFDGNISLDEAIENIKRETRRYAKRQLTWFKSQANVHWLYVDEINSKEELVNQAKMLVSHFLE